MWVTGEYFDGLRAAELAARGRLDAPAQADPFLRLDWFARSWEHARRGVRPLIARARAGPAEAWLFLARTHPNRLVPLAGPHTQRFAPIFVGDPDEALKRALLGAHARRLKLFGVGRAVLEPLLPEHAAALRQAFRGAGWVVIEDAAASNFLLDVGGRSFDDYWESCPPPLHEQIASGSRHLTVEIADLISPRLWQEVELVGGGADPFLRALAEDASVDGTLRLGVARVGDAPVAAQIWIIEGASAIAHWRAQDCEAKQLYPTTQLTASMLRYLVNVDHAQSIDLGNGREADLADWADQRRVLRRLNLFNPREPSAWAPALAASVGALARRSPLD